MASPEREIGLKLSTFQPASLQQNLKSTTSRLYIRKDTPNFYFQNLDTNSPFCLLFIAHNFGSEKLIVKLK